MSETEDTGVNSIPIIDGGFVCLVDGDGEYNPDENRLTELLDYVDPKKTQDYAIVGIMGCQSTGKSTLLNQLFETKFQMMDSSRGRSQTTKGIWLDAARNQRNLVVMDLEGTDSGERGEDRTTFERQTILYGLALCEILIVNMWEHDIGRYTASNYGVLKTVFEVNLQLFKGQGRTMLLFIVRDHVEQHTPMSSLIVKLRRDIENIWAELPKPAEYANHTVDDHFEFCFEWLPHFHLQREEFFERCTYLRNKFIDPAAEGNFLQTDFHGKKSVPTDGFAHYSQTVWDTIRTSKDLDLPTQKEMLATFRCDELTSHALAAFAHAIAPVRDEARAGPVPDLGARLGLPASAALDAFDTGSRKYVGAVVTKKRSDLVGKLAEPITELVQDQLTSHVIAPAVADFATALAAKLDAAEDAGQEFHALAAGAKEAAGEDLRARIAALAEGLPEEFAVDCAAKAAEAEGKLAAVVAAQRTRVLESVCASLTAAFSKDLRPRVTALFRESPEDLWARISADFSSLFSEVATLSVDLLAALEVSPEERASLLSAVASRVEAEVRDMAGQHALIVALKLRNRFEALFLRDEQGVRRRWGAKDDVRALFAKSRDGALTLLPLYEAFRFRDGLDAAAQDALRGCEEPNEELLSAVQVAEMESQFVAEIATAEYDALRDQERNAQSSHLPPWAIALIVFLGWNEFMALLRNPFVLMLVITLGAAALVVNALGMWGPVTAGLKMTMNQLLAQGQALITPVTNTTDAGASAAAAPVEGAAPKGMQRRVSRGPRNYATLPAGAFKSAGSPAPLVRPSTLSGALNPSAAAAGLAPLATTPRAGDAGFVGAAASTPSAAAAAAAVASVGAGVGAIPEEPEESEAAETDSLRERN